MGLTDRIRSVLGSRNQTISYSDLLDLAQFSFQGNAYLVGALNETLRGKAEEINTSYDGLVQQAYRTSGVVFACELARMQLFSEARFQFQELRNGRPGNLF